MSAHAVTHSIHATSRDLAGVTAKQLRRDGKVPAVLYGNVKENAHLVLNEREFTKLFHQTGYSTLINLVIDSEKPVKVLVHDLQDNPVRGEITHIDFFAVNMKEKLSTEVPLEFTGTAAAVEDLGGTLITVKSEVEVECLPDDLPHSIIVDITALATFDDVIRISDLAAPEGVVILGEPEEVIASISEPMSEEELAALDEAPATEVETEFETTSGTDSEAGEGEADSDKKDE